MAIMDLEYIEVDGVLHPNIELGGSELLKYLGKYGRLRLEYLQRFKQELYRELLFGGNLPEHCAAVDMRAYELSERIHTYYLKQPPCRRRMRWSVFVSRSRRRLLPMK